MDPFVPHSGILFAPGCTLHFIQDRFGERGDRPITFVKDKLFTHMLCAGYNLTQDML
jgi:hypothetical protein